MEDFFVWRDEYALGRPEIDREHQALFRIAQELNAAMSAGHAQDELAAIYARLVAYTRFHFANEEALMRSAGYSDLAQHAREHDRLTAKVARLEREFEEGSAAVTAETMEFLRRWLKHHILGADQKVAKHLSGDKP